MTGRNTAIQIFNAAVRAVTPAVLLPQHIQRGDGALIINKQRLALQHYHGVYVLSVGKAAAAMAREAEKILGDEITNGLVVTKYHHALALKRCKTIEAGHPVPDQNGIIAARAIVEFLQPLTNKSLLLCFISGGASALIADAVEGITLDDMRTIANLLLQCGADIHEINTVRKHLSFLKGGQLVRHANGAQIFSFIISDVPGDDLSVIASGLTVGDPSTFADAWGIVEKYTLAQKLPIAVRQRLLGGINNTVQETPKPGSHLFGKVRNDIIGTNVIAVKAAAACAKSLGFMPVINDNLLQGEAKQAAKNFIQILLSYKGDTPACFIAGGETTVTIKGKGKGGRNQEFVLAAVCELLRLDVPLEKLPVILSAGTDGTDGPTEAAGAIIDMPNFLHIRKLGINAENFLDNNDSFRFFEQIESLIITGATLTNVMDVAIGLII